MVTALARNEGDLLADGGLTGLPLHPLPDLRFAARVGEDDEVLERAFGDLALDFAPNRVLRDVVVYAGVALVDGEPALLRDGLEGVFAAVDEDGHRLGLVVVPA